MKTDIYNQSGKKTGEISLPESVFGLSWNNDLVHQVAVSMMSNQRTVVAHTKGRGDVSGGGIKPWRQKGTGRARHGSRRSPIWVGGGITFGPTNDRNFNKKINKKMRTKALFVVLSQKLRDGEILFVDNFDIKEPKTKDAKAIIASLSKVDSFANLLTKKKNTAFISVDEKNENLEKSFGNFSNMTVGEIRNLNILNLLNNKYLIVLNPEKAVEFLSAKI